MYDLKKGLSLQSDPIEFDSGSLSLYSYVGNNPLGFADPSGYAALGNL